MQQPIPIASWPMVSPAGTVNDIWYQFFQALYSRTGGATGVIPVPANPDLTALQTAVSDIIAIKIPALQQGAADLGVLALIGDETPQASARIDLSALDDLRVLALTQEP